VPTLDEVNRLSPREFSAAFGAVYEHSPWIAERALATRPFASREALQSALYGALHASSDDEKLALIRAHPMLAGKEADAGHADRSLRTRAGRGGLGALTPDQRAELAILNARYADAFGFPFVICARLNRRDAILGRCARAFTTRASRRSRTRSPDRRDRAAARRGPRELTWRSSRPTCSTRCTAGRPPACASSCIRSGPAERR
jgi:2-oxo-4-hydroxy-4-carboxy-5-ureidoimidazoline decarboxylase